MINTFNPEPFSLSSALPTLLIIPTGIGCTLGGFAGDAIPAARLLASASGCLITHPNVMNGASLYWSDSNIHYVEGYSLDQFAIEKISLRPVRKQQVGLLLDSGLDNQSKQRHIQVALSCKATLGIDVGPIITTEAPLEIHLRQGNSGTSWGTLSQVEALLKAGKILKEAGATAIAVVTRFPDCLDSQAIQKYQAGEDVDILSGAEAVISHLLVKHLSIPCAHAPALKSIPLNEGLDPRAAAEEIGHTFLPCVLVGLSKAPDLIPINKEQFTQSITNSEYIHMNQVGAVIAPDGALGGEAVLASLERNIPLIVVSNKNILNVNFQSLIMHHESFSKENLRILHAKNYVEAAGLILLLREGLNVESIYRPINSINEIKT